MLNEPMCGQVVKGRKSSAKPLTLVEMSLEIPSGLLRKANLFSSVNKPNGAVNCCGSLENMPSGVVQGKYDVGNRRQWP